MTNELISLLAKGILGNELENSENDKSTRVCAYNALKAFYQRYGKSELGKVICLYEGTYEGGEYKSYDYINSDGYVPIIEDTRYAFVVKFDMEE